MFVFGEVQDPTTETVNLVEDIVRGQIIELVCANFTPWSSRDTHFGDALTGCLPFHPIARPCHYSITSEDRSSA